MKYLLSSMFLVSLPAALLAENVFKFNLKPEQVQEYLNKFNEYALKTGENPLPEARNGNRQFVYFGRVIDHPEDYVEEHYGAHQYHGQNGLGQYAYNYRDWNQGKNEKKDENGKVTGAYKYVKLTGRDFIGDNTGFYVEDRDLTSPPTQSREIRKAEEEHYRLYKEIAHAGGHNTDLFTRTYEQQGRQLPEGDNYKPYVHKEPEYGPGPEGRGPYRGFYVFDYNVPLHLKNPPTKTYAVRKAEEEHYKLYKEIAHASGHNTDLFTRIYEQQGRQLPKGDNYKPYVHKEPEYGPGPEGRGPYRGFYAFDYNRPLLRNK